MGKDGNEKETDRPGRTPGENEGQLQPPASSLQPAPKARRTAVGRHRAEHLKSNLCEVCVCV
ncbi:hypothetical protein CMEL01_00829 [Colletotrichum melonis]|uniref:Uncharacterized protein n=1 Tax=Colletotrichum melonis TaxID=1209925 RepID=A0AAI9Y348_9PEZI|nr:hypothetical protein CMEL01_00829 [Colletotrichum melonis]